MSSTAAPTNPNELLFPAFLYGDHATCRRRYKAEVKKWAKRYQEQGDFPEPKLISVPPGAVMWTNDGAAEMLMLGSHERRKNPNWHFHLLEVMQAEVSPGDDTRELFYAAYESFISRYPWGALSLLIHHPMHLTIAHVSRRLEAVLSFWEQLYALRYINVYLQEVDLAQLLTLHTYDIMLTWVEAPVGRSTRGVLREVMERMRNATEDEIRARMMRRLHQVADTDPKLKHREWLKSPGRIEMELAELKETNLEWYDLLGVGGGFSDFLVELEKKYPGS